MHEASRRYAMQRKQGRFSSHLSLAFRQLVQALLTGRSTGSPPDRDRRAACCSRMVRAVEAVSGPVGVARLYWYGACCCWSCCC